MFTRRKMENSTVQASAYESFRKFILKDIFIGRRPLKTDKKPHLNLVSVVKK